MKFTTPLLLAIFLFTFNNLVFAQPINLNTAKKVAQNHLLSVVQNKLKSASPNQSKFQFSSLSVTSESKDTLYFVLNDTINQSFVIVAADKRSTPIIGYSLEGNYNENNQPPAFVAWMENRKQEIESIKENNLQPDSKISKQWDKLSSSNFDATQTTTSVEPLLKTKWNQDCFYNELCPSDAGGPCAHVLTGCVATSMAQIMKYWNYPTNGTGSHSYLSAGYGILSADFSSTTYQWSQMPDVATSQNDDIATLMFHCGVALDMRYSPIGSGSYDPRDELVKYFNYSSMAEYVDKRSFLPGDWVNLLKSELDYGRPIWYNGARLSCGGGHAFICDGYQNSDYFHFNWGWGGSFDGYFYLESLNPSGYSFSVFQAAIIKIFPSSLPDEYHGFMLSSKTVGIGTKGGTAKLDIYSSTDWKALSDQTWLTIDPVAGTPSSKAITFNVTANPSKNIRKATVTISTSEFASQTISVTQYGQVEVTAGSLKTALGDQLSTTTSLKLNGTIDARDFRTMRDDMPALTEIDLSEVKIASYTGTEGTVWDENYIYQANSIPSFTFLFPKSVRAKSRLQSIVLPLSITSINDYAFQGCKNLTIDNIPSSVTSIGDGAFLECNCFKPLMIPSSVKFIGAGAFNSFNGTLLVDVNNPNYSSVDGVLFNKTKTKLIQCPVSKTGNYTIPSSVTSIKNCAFQGCNGLTTVSIPSSVTAIEDYAFIYCTGLTSIMIPQTVTSIGQRAFGGINGSIIIDANNANYSSIDGVLYSKNQTEIIQCPVSKAGTYTIPSTVTNVKEEAFHSCINIATIIIPSSVKNIGSFSFNCVGLSSIYVYSVPPVNLLHSLVFSSVDTLACILNVPFGTKAHYAAASQWKSFMNIVEMPGLFLSDKTIGIECKGGNFLLNVSSSEKWTATSDQTWLTLNNQSGDEGFNEIILNALANPTANSRKATITISATGLASQTIEVTQYSTVATTAGNLKTMLSDHLAIITSLNLTGTIDARDFKIMRDEMPALTAINLNNVKIMEYNGSEGTSDISPWFYPANTIPDHAFYNSKSPYSKNFPNSIILPSSVTSIGSYAFNNCTGLTTISIPPLVTSIGSYAFSRCNGLTIISIPSSVTLIQDNAFGNLNALISVEANNHNYSSIDGVLYDKDQTRIIQCPSSKTESFIIPSSVTTICNYAFSNCAYLTNIAIPTTVTAIEEGVFLYCYGLTSVKIPSGVASIGRNLFAYCDKLTSITIPSSVTSIGSWAFMGCSGLTSIYSYTKSLIDLNYSSDVFSGVNKKSCTLYVPYGSKAAYQAANQWKDFENIIEVQNQAPVANAGPDQTINTGKLVTLNGNDSGDPEGNSLTYKWTVPAGITLNTTTVSKPTFTAPDVITNTNFTFSLIVNDGVLDSPADQVEITVTPNKAPTANAGTDQTVNENSLCTLDGSASSDPDKDALTYLWIAPSGITLSSNTTPKPTFTAPEVTTDTNYTFSLVVKDGSLNSTADQIAVTVKHINKTPTANAGNDQIVNENSLCTLDGSSSSDPDNDALTYLWTAPAGITLSSNTASKPTFTAPEISIDTKYTFSLVVNDGFLNSTADPVIITVKNVDKAPYLKNPISNISVDKRAPDQIIDLKTVFADDDFADVLSYSITSNSNNQVVSTKITGSNLTLSFSSLNIGLTEIVITANSNGKVVITKFNVEVKIPTETNPLVRNQKLTVFPNPTNGKIEIVFDQIPRGGIELIVTDIIGRTILKQIIQENEEWIDITGYSPGIYLFKTNLDDSTVQKVILK